ncbi:tail fiber domain-containing protein, partial [Flavobacteriales bacterium]|nr:tail fiber domain-containing protein [Flavobacteriales bacterium]
MILRLTILVSFSILSLCSFAQEFRLIDNKGSLQYVTRNSVDSSSIAPLNPVEGDVWFDTSNKITKVYDGTSWLEIQASSALSIWDKDEDTGIQVEESADDDIIRFDANGREVLRLEEDKMVLSMKPLNTNGGGASSISFVPALDAVNNVQLTLIETNGVGNSAENGFRYLVGNSLPTIDGVNGDGTVARHVNLGQPGSGSNVGIGYATSTPQSSIIHKLQVRGNARIGSLGEELQIGHVGHNNWAGIAHMNRATANNYALMQNTTGVTLLNAGGSQYISLRINNVQGAILDANRNFGINVGTVTQKLDVNGAGIFRRGGNNVNFTNNQLLFGYNGTANYRHALRTRHNSGADAGNAIDFFTWDAGTDADADDPTLHGLTIAGGRVGIGGVTSPTQVLDVDGAGLFRRGGNNVNFTNNQLLFGYNGTVNYKHALRTRHNSGADAGNAIDFFTWDAGTDADADDPTLHGLTIAGGRIGIGGVTSPTQVLDVDGTARLRSLGSGTIQSDATGVLSVSSDERLKNIVSSFDKGLDEILKLKPINYNWNNLSGLEQEN